MAFRRDASHSEVTEDYLKAIADAEEWGALGISVGDLAQRMKVRASTASENVARLVDLGLVDHEPYQQVHLTDEGRRLARAMVRRHRILETYLHDCLEFDWDAVHQEAEVLEHAVSDTLLKHMDQALGHPTRDPHGHPIPGADGTWIVPRTQPLRLVEAGQSAVIVRINDDLPPVLRTLEHHHLVPDQTITVVTSDNQSTTVAVNGVSVVLTPEQADAIFVQA